MLDLRKLGVEDEIQAIWTHRAQRELCEFRWCIYRWPHRGAHGTKRRRSRFERLESGVQLHRNFAAVVQFDQVQFDRFSPLPMKYKVLRTIISCLRGFDIGFHPGALAGWQWNQKQNLFTET